MCNTEKEDIVQEVFSRLYLNLKQIHPSKIKAWLVTTARNLAKDHFNKNKRQKTDVCHLTATQTEFSIWRKKEDKSSEEMIDQLCELTASHSMKTIHSFYFLAKPVKEIAIERGQKLSSITSALTRERKQLISELIKTA